MTPAGIECDPRQHMTIGVDMTDTAKTYMSAGHEMDCHAAQPAPAPEAVPPAFDAEGFRAWVLRELPDETIIGKGAWWADHFTKCVQWFIKAGAAPVAQQAEPTIWQVMAAAKALHSTAQDNREWDELRQHEIDALRLRATSVLQAAHPQHPAPKGDPAPIERATVLVPDADRLKATAAFYDETFADGVRSVRSQNPAPQPLTDDALRDIADGFRSQYHHAGTTFDEFDATGYGRAVLAAAGISTAAVAPTTDTPKE